MIPDYLALLKIRIMLLVMKYTNPRNTSLIVTVIIDFVVGVWAFLTSYAALLTVFSIVLAGDKLSISSVITGLGLFFTIELSSDVSTGYLFVAVPVANMFWASMLPAMWLWAYIMSSLLTRMLTASKPALRRAINFLDVTNHPVRCVGLLAAFVPAVVCGAVLIGLSFI